MNSTPASSASESPPEAGDTPDSVPPPPEKPAGRAKPAAKPPAAAAAAAPKKNKRYMCHCGKSFTTSGHLARHMRVHTGEKNYVCPEEGCEARFSRQDNCMQHYRTHQNANRRTG
ncbi:uncharacterized protein V1510DRAFT_360889, partial [Dipodascopsis tothii]|uniref:uncharacterized protein n=1 Tax=Dipodascopsis tothii TaxID=44089 RepID=UPI0034CFF741